MRIQNLTADFFQGEPLPQGTEMVGWSALVHSLGVAAPVHNPSCVSQRHVLGSKRSDGTWNIYDKRYRPGPTLKGHLTFAMRHETIDLLLLKRILQAVPEATLVEMIRAKPKGTTARKIWFFFETLTGKRLDIADAPAVTAVDALDPDRYYTAGRQISPRHRVRNNLLGTGDLCPIIRRTPKLEKMIALDLSAKTRDTIGKAGAQLIARAASFVLLEDSRASFEIEGEHPPVNRLERWGRAVMEAGKRPLRQTEIYRLHSILIGNDRSRTTGYRTEEVFLGPRNRNYEPLPEFIGARHKDIERAMNALNECGDRLRSSDVDPVLHAACVAFGFVYIHPFTDGNGRLHRCLIHQVLAERGFTPPQMVFPVSSVMLSRIDDYGATLRAHSGPLMQFIAWRALPNGNVEVTNDTSDLYCYYDCTNEAEFLYDCILQTIEFDLPREIDYLKRHDVAVRRIINAFDVPNRTAEEIIMLIRRNGGVFPKKRRKKEFARFTESEIASLETIVAEGFADFDQE
ncbi:MAG: Fic family protein [Candidatus Dadabacteria bacterium]|nr:Fic family protein [Candidatus Dadabacteria bacterium]